MIGLVTLSAGALRQATLSLERQVVRTEKAAAEQAKAAGRPQAEIDVHLQMAAEAERAPEHFPPELLLIYGLWYSAVLGLIYAPAYTALRTDGRQVLNDIFPPLFPGDPKYDEREKARTQLSGVLHLGVGVTDSVKLIGVVLVPLATTLVSLLVGVKTG